MGSRRWTVIAATGLVALVAAGCSSDTTSSGGASPAAAAKPVIDPGDHGRYAPHLDPANFVPDVTNPWFPLPAGATWTYEGQEAGSTEHIDVRVLPERTTVMGIPAVVVRDTVTVDGRVAEDTFDWYAQDRTGNVWYLGEDTKELDHGKVTSTAGSWEGGVNGALPGIIMQADPKVGDAYRQVYLKGEAEDLAEVTATNSADRVPAGAFRDLVTVTEWNPLHPKVIEAKKYARGVGPIVELVTRGGSGRVELLRSSLTG
jgi:hypothetical protein